MNTNTYGDISPRTAGHAARKMLEVGQSLLVTERFGQVDPQQKKTGLTRKWRRYNSLPKATSPLAEGITPSGQKITYEDVQANLEEFGDFVEITDVVIDTHEDPVLDTMSKRCGEQAAETVEAVRINHLKAGTNVYYANGVTSRASVNSPAVRGDLRKIVRAFKRNKAREISTIIKASAKISTESVGSAYFAMGHTDLDSDIRNLPGFIPVKDYSDSTKALPGEIGSLESIRFILTKEFEPWSAAGYSGTTYLSDGAEPSTSAQCDVYPLIIVAQDAYAIVPLQGKKAIKPFVVNPAHTDSDPLAQRGKVGWKSYQGAAILNQLWMARLEVACTANPN